MKDTVEEGGARDHAPWCQKPIILSLILLLTWTALGCSMPEMPSALPTPSVEALLDIASPTATRHTAHVPGLGVTATPSLSPTFTSTSQSPAATGIATLMPSSTRPFTATPLPSSTMTPSPTETRTATRTPDVSVIRPQEGVSILRHNQVIGDYGRGFNLAPSHELVMRKLGHTGFFRSADEYLNGSDEREGILARAAQLDASNGPDIGVVPAIFLIYEGSALLPNWPNADFLIGAPELYEHIAGVDYAATHMAPFSPENLGRPFMIFLDHQLGYGGELPVSRAIQEMLPLLQAYPNVHFFLDPEFRVTEAHKASVAQGESLAPGVPVGYVDADDINSAQRLVQAYMQAHDLAEWRRAQGGTAEVIVGIHQFQDLNIGRGTPHADTRTMIIGKERIEHVPGVTVVFDYDGVHPAKYGGAPAKLRRYRQTMDDDAYPCMMHWAYPGIKVFPFNPFWTSDRYDERPFSLEELSGQQAIPDVGRFGDGCPLPRVIIIT